MHKYIIILFLIIFCSNCVPAQTIDKLAKTLPSLKDTARVDCLIEISVQYLFKPDNDSALYYADLAYQESKKINYINGIAQSFCPKAAVQNHLYNDFHKMEQLARESLKWYKLTANKKGVEIPYWQVGAALFTQGKYDEALIYLNQSYETALKAGNQFSNSALEKLTDVYRERGDYVKLLETQQKIIQFERESGDTKDYTFHELWVMGLMYMLLEEYSTALPFWRRLFLIESEVGFGSTWNLTEYAQLLTLSNQTDSALYYYNQFDSAKADIKDLRFFLVSKGEYYMAKKEYTKALPNFQKGLVLHQQLNDRNQVKRTLLDIGKCYAVLENNDSATRYAKEGLGMALQTKSKPYIRDGYEILYSIYNRLNETDSAYYYYRNYIAMKEGVMNDQTRGKLAAYKFEQKINLLSKEKEIQQARMQKQSILKNALIAGLLVLLLLGIFIFRNIMLKRKNEKNLRQIAENDLRLQQLESEKTKAELQQQATELEMQALRAQMNPHFIFNSLNSINRFILQNNKVQASEYLTKFSRLVRLILQNSQASLIPLESELESLQLYLELEAVRFDHHFEFKISVDDGLDTYTIKVPPLIIQPYAENAIWHGLMHREEKGHLEIELSLQKEALCCRITDDGIGRKKASELKIKSGSTHKSMGMRITADRIAILQQEKQPGTYIKITDLVLADGSAGGTEVLLKIPLMQQNKP